MRTQIDLKLVPIASEFYGFQISRDVWKVSKGSINSCISFRAFPYRDKRMAPWLVVARLTHRAKHRNLLTLVHCQHLDFGAADPLIPLSEVAQIQSAFSNHYFVEIRIHPDSGHGFSHLGTPRCNPKAAESAARGVETLIVQCRR